MRWPSMMTPLPVASAGACFAQGLATSGRRMVENTFTTADSASWLIASSGALAARACELTLSNSSDSTRFGQMRVMEARLHLAGRADKCRADSDTETLPLPFPHDLTYPQRC